MDVWRNIKLHLVRPLTPSKSAHGLASIEVHDFAWCYIIYVIGTCIFPSHRTDVVRMLLETAFRYFDHAHGRTYP
jgi:hypothetical protein